MKILVTRLIGSKVYSVFLQVIEWEMSILNYFKLTSHYFFTVLVLPKEELLVPVLKNLFMFSFSESLPIYSTRDIIYDEQGRYLGRHLCRFSVSNFIDLNFSKLTISPKENWWNEKTIFSLGCGCKVQLFRIFLLNDCCRSKNREEFDFSVVDFGGS